MLSLLTPEFVQFDPIFLEWMYPFDKYSLCTCCMPDLHLGSKDTTVNKQGPHCHWIHILEGIIKKGKIHIHMYTQRMKITLEKSSVNIFRECYTAACEDWLIDWLL